MEGGIATTARTGRAKRCDGRGRGTGRRWNVKTPTAGTKRSTGTAGATTQRPSRTELCSSSCKWRPLPHIFLWLSHLSSFTVPHTPSPSNPLRTGVLLLPVQKNRLVLHQHHGARSATCDFKMFPFFKPSCTAPAQSASPGKEQDCRDVCGGQVDWETQCACSCGYLMELWYIHCVSRVLNVDFTALCRTVFYYYCCCIGS